MVYRLKSNFCKSTNTDKKSMMKTPISMNFLYWYKKGGQTTNLLSFKLKRSIKENVEFTCIYKINQLSMFCVTNGNITERRRVNVTYRITCLGGLKKHGKQVENCNFIVVHNNCSFVLDCCFCSRF